jgi:hypothetical protein
MASASASAFLCVLVRQFRDAHLEILANRNAVCSCSSACAAPIDGRASC